MKDRLLFIFVMLIFGSIGIFVKNIHLSSSEIAFFRAAIGSLFLMMLMLLTKRKLSLNTSGKNWLLLILSGTAMGFNWIFLFEAYKYTTIPNATLSYYFAPVFVMILAPVFLKEKWLWLNGASMLGAMTGLFFVISPWEESIAVSFDHSTGITYGLTAAAFYASVILINKFIKNFSGYETAVVQLFIASIVLFPYVLMTEKISWIALDHASWLLLFIIGIIHTGIAYFFYFSTLQKLSGQTIAVFSYIDPISAVILAAVILKETMDPLQIIGACFILGSTFLNEFSGRQRKVRMRKGFAKKLVK